MSEKKAKKWARASEGRGFTLAETLIAVALIGVMAAIAFIGVVRWRTTMKQLEYDAKAKEIYVAAQNHLTLAESQGLLESTAMKYGEPEAEAPVGSEGSTPDNTGIHYFVSGEADWLGDMLSVMLPFGSIDESVRAGGSFIIRYQPDIAAVLDVFYTEDVELTKGDYTTLKDLRTDDNDAKKARQSFDAHYGKAIIGYYGGDTEGTATVKLKAPSVQVHNGDTLKVVVSYPMANENVLSREGAEPKAKLQLVIEELDFEGKSADARAKRFITLTKAVNQPTSGKNEIYEVTLDDVTKSVTTLSTMEWEEGQTNDIKFIPGSNLKIYAKVQSTDKALRDDGKQIIAIAKSNEVETNQSFAQTAEVDEHGTLTVEVSSFRHLANLSKRVSGFDGATYRSVVANQTSDISWARFTKNISKEHNEGSDANAGDTVIVCTDNSSSESGTFLPVNPTGYTLVYDGLKKDKNATTAVAHKISLVEVDATGSAGIFGELIGTGSEIKNLVVVNANVNAQVSETAPKASAGALVGTLSGGAKVSNVLVRTTLTSTNSSTADKYATRGVASAGVAGGLVGTVTGGATVTDSAAAVYVKAVGGTAGGLVGSATDSTIESSYSSAHIQSTTGTYDAANVDVDAAQNDGTMGTAAGGLVGSASNTTIDSCYSTCSVGNASSVGGLVGSVGAGSISDCYVTGLVTNPTTTDGNVGTFIGARKSGSATSLTGDHYYKVVNGTEAKSIGDAKEDEVISDVSPFDETPYDNGWKTSGALKKYFTTSSPAVPYNQYLATRYNGKYAFKTIAESASDTSAFTDHLTRHYGDWPAYDVLFVNSGS